MNKIFPILYFSLIFIFASFSQENPAVKNIRDCMISNINKVNSLRAKLLDPEVDATQDLTGLKEEGLVTAFFYNDNKIMYREFNINEAVSPHTSTLHMNFVNLQTVSQQKIYISELYVIKGKAYYFIGCKSDRKYMLMLFNISDKVELSENFSLINAKGEVILSNKPDSVKLKTIIKKINDPKTESVFFTQNSINKFKFFPYHETYYYIKYN